MDRRTALLIAGAAIFPGCQRATTSGATPLPAPSVSCDTTAGRSPSLSLTTVDASTGKGIPAFIFSLAVARSGWYADSSGHLNIDLGAGTYDLKFRLVGYRGRSAQIVLVPGARCAVVVPMARDTLQLPPIGTRGGSLTSG